jgi:hypothetical protein
VIARVERSLHGQQQGTDLLIFSFASEFEYKFAIDTFGSQEVCNI